jgi:bacterioferritin-associated ferredoxin
VSDREIRRAVRAGACTVREVAEACGAASACGGCRATVLELLDEGETALERRGLSVSISPEAA